ncbi:hypothetical protein OCU04_008270 [Sclerotinia nivalis]|uniref:Uncharacterized protein n=1 Tax=Sclerotinia nivalis TaxID=352851 RepID=A0A9X0AHQ8_9HELO|nr:hypothetical protein OCU04_008270 [Sclerotinia nivalis]
MLTYDAIKKRAYAPKILASLGFAHHISSYVHQSMTSPETKEEQKILQSRGDVMASCALSKATNICDQQVSPFLATFRHRTPRVSQIIAPMQDCSANIMF